MGLELAAVATNSRETAAAAARAFGVAAAFGSGIELIAAPGIDLVTITTRVPDHRELVLAALAAGKHVYCEWPLGRNVAEAKEMATAAHAAGVHVAIGLQLRGSPVVQRARALIDDGALGRILSMRVYGSTAGFGPVVPAPFLYLESPENFANLITIQAAHAIDLGIALAGAFSDLSALATAQFPEIEAGDEHTKQARTTFDHLVLQSRFARRSTLSLEVAGGRPPGTPFELEVVGDRNVLRLTGGAARGFQTGRLTLLIDGEPQNVDEGELASIPDAAANVAGIYAALRDGIAHGRRTVADFEHAVALTQLVTDLFDSSANGHRVDADGWPER